MILEFLETYVGVVEKTLEALQKGLRARDEVWLEELCHGLHGASVNMEAGRMVVQCRRLKRLVEEESWHTAELVVENMDALVPAYRACAGRMKERMRDGVG